MGQGPLTGETLVTYLTNSFHFTIASLLIFRHNCQCERCMMNYAWHSFGFTAAHVVQQDASVLAMWGTDLRAKSSESE